MSNELHCQVTISKVSLDMISTIVMPVDYSFLLICASILSLGIGSNVNPRSGFDATYAVPNSLQHVTSHRFPQFQEVSPCTCDVTVNKCDIGCCCDSECSKKNNINITCVQGKIKYERIIQIFII